MTPAGRPSRVRRWADFLARVALRALRGARLPGDNRDPGGAPAPIPASAPRGDASSPDDVAEVLRRLCGSAGAVRMIVWEHDRDRGLLVPAHSSHDAPAAVTAAGDPVAWALAQGQPIRLDRTPVWAEGPVTAAPLAPRLALTAEGEGVTPPPAYVADAAVVVRAFLDALDRERHAATRAGRFDRFVAFLKALPGGADAAGFPEALARAVAEMADADGAVVASWKEDRGRVLARWGAGGGPAEGTYFAVLDGELAHAARAGTTIRRSDLGRAPILAQAGERWTVPPSHLAVVPLVDTTGSAAGVIAFWGEERPDEAAIELVQALASLLALQLQHSTDLVRFRERAHEDALTGLRNRAALEERLADERHRFHRYRRPVSLLVLDLDHFKRVNDTWGHPAGDAVLQRVAEILRAAIRDEDVAVRFGGEEMVVILPETMRREAGEVAERIRKAVAGAAIEWGARPIPVTASIGVSSCPETVEDPDELMKSADEALYASKREGRNRVTVAMKVTHEA